MMVVLPPQEARVDAVGMGGRDTTSVLPPIY